MINTLILAQAAAAPAPQPVMMWGWMAIMAALFYFAIIRPQRRQAKERAAMMSALKTGDRVLLSGGILGIIGSVKEHTVNVKIAENVKVEALRTSISRVLDKDTNLGEVAETK